MRLLVLVSAVFVLAVVATGAAAPALPVRSLDGSGNNAQHPDWGKAGTQYSRVAAPTFADGVAAMTAGPPSRYVSNRIFNDVGQNLFSENRVSQWGWAWGQFLDHDFGLRDETPAESASIAFTAGDPLEAFRNDFGVIPFSRTPAAPGTGVGSPRQQINTISSFIDASNVYGTTAARLDWLREGPLDGNPSNNGARLFLTKTGYLPRADARGNPAAAPAVDLMGQLVMTPSRAAIAGDVRANENIALTGLHTLFAREHNRIVAALPRALSDEARFQIARRVVGAEIQWITYNEFLPALGVGLGRYRGYNPRVNPSLSNEFAVVGYRAHSMIHGEFEPVVKAGTFSQAQLAGFEAAGVEVEEEGDEVTLGIPLNLAFGNPDLLEKVGLGTLLASLGAESQYKNDEQIDNSLRSVLFQVPKPGSPDPAACMLPAPVPSCFTGTVDLGAIDIERGRDHGMPSYNALRRAYGLPTKRSFTDITGEATERFASDPQISENPIDDPSILDFVQLRDGAGNVLAADSEEAVVGTRRSTLAARLKAIYGSVDRVDAFVGMVSEPHVRGSELGPLQLAIWKRQFEALRDGDRFFYANDPALSFIARYYRIDFRRRLSEIIERNTGVDVARDVFKAPA